MFGPWGPAAQLDPPVDRALLSSCRLSVYIVTIPLSVTVWLQFAMQILTGGSDQPSTQSVARHYCSSCRWTSMCLEGAVLDAVLPRRVARSSSSSASISRGKYRAGGWSASRFGTWANTVRRQSHREFPFRK